MKWLVMILLFSCMAQANSAEVKGAAIVLEIEDENSTHKLETKLQLPYDKEVCVVGGLGYLEVHTDRGAVKELAVKDGKKRCITLEKKRELNQASIWAKLVGFFDKNSTDGKAEGVSIKEGDFDFEHERK